MVTKKTRLISGVAAVLMLISMLTAFVLPASAAGNAWDQYETVSATGLVDKTGLPNIKNYTTGVTEVQVNDRAGMEKLRDLVFDGNAMTGVTIYQTADIDMGWKAFVGIGHATSRAFSGTFDGNGFTIDNLYILKNDQNSGGAALFNYVNKGTIRNVGIASGFVIGKAWTAGVAGRVTNGSQIVNCWNAATIVGFTDGTAGIAGSSIDAGTDIINCYNLGMLINYTSKVAGVTGWINHADNNVTNCYNAGEIVSAFMGVAKSEELHAYSAVLNADFSQVRGEENANNYYVKNRGKAGSVKELWDAVEEGTLPSVPADYDRNPGAEIKTNDQATGVDAAALTDEGETGLAALLNTGDLSAGNGAGYTVSFEVSDIGYPVLTYKNGDTVVAKRVAHGTVNVNGEHETWAAKSKIFKIMFDSVDGGFAAEVHPLDDLVLETANDFFAYGVLSNGSAHSGSNFGNNNLSLENDIDMNDMDVLPLDYDIPLAGGSGGDFRGTFNGNHHVIRNWKGLGMTTGGNPRAGIFSYVTGTTTIKDLGIVNSYVAYEKYAGSAGWTYPSALIEQLGDTAYLTMSNVYATGVLDHLNAAANNPNNVSGLIGRRFGGKTGEVNVTDCWTKMEVRNDLRAEGARVIGSSADNGGDGAMYVNTKNNYYFTPSLPYDDGAAGNILAREPYQTMVSDASVVNNNAGIAAYLNGKMSQKYKVNAAGEVVFAESAAEATYTVTLKMMSGGVQTGTEKYYFNAGSAASFEIPEGYEVIEDSTLPEGAASGSFTMPAENVEIMLNAVSADWSAVENLIAEYESIDFDSIVDGETMRDMLAEMKEVYANRAEMTDEEALGFIAYVLEADAALDKSLNEGYYPRYAIKDRYDPSYTDFAISTKEDWLAVTKDKDAAGFSGITLHFTNDIDMENTNMTPVAPVNWFQGTIDGHGYVMKNVRMVMNLNASYQGAGLVSYLGNNGAIRNLGIASGYYEVLMDNQSSDDRALGAFAGAATAGATFYRCWNAATLVGKTNSAAINVSGIVGRGYNDSVIDSCFNIGTIDTTFNGAQLNCWGQCGDKQTGGKIYNSFGAGEMIGSGNGNILCRYNTSGTVAAVQENRFPAFNSYNVGGFITLTSAFNGLSADFANPNETYAIGADALATGEVLYKINQGYESGKGTMPYFTFDAEGNVAYGNMETQIRKLTYQLDGENVAVRYVPGDTDYTLDYARGANYELIEAAGATLDGATLHTSKLGDMIVKILPGDKNYIALEEALAKFDAVNDYRFIVNGEAVKTLVETVAGKIEADSYANQAEIDADAKAINDAYVLVSSDQMPSAKDASDQYSWLPGYTIGSLEDWNYVVANPQLFANIEKTLYLSADLDLENQTLFRWPNTVRMSFDGLGHTIKNMRVASNLFGANYSGKEIKNVTFESCTATNCEWNSAMLVGQYQGDALLFENITMKDCVAEKTSANGLSLLLGQANNNRKVTYRNIEITGSTLNNNNNGNLGFLGGTLNAIVTVENVYLNNNTIAGLSAGWGDGILFGELANCKVEAKKIGVFNTTRTPNTDDMNPWIHGVIVGNSKGSTMNICDAVLGNNAKSIHWASTNSAICSDNAVTLTQENIITDTPYIYLRGTTNNVGDGSIPSPYANKTDDVMGGAAIYELNKTADVKWEIAAGADAPSIDTDGAGLPVKVSLTTAEKTVDLYTNTEGKLIGLTEEIFKSATWEGYETIDEMNAAVFTEDTVLEGTACVHDWQYRTKNDGTHEKYCAVEGGCGATEILDCEYEIAKSTDHENHTKTCKYCGYETSETCTIETNEIPATCTENKKIERGCSVCGDVTVTEVEGTALGHDWTYTHTEGTAETSSTHSKSCTRCDVEAVVEGCTFSEVVTAPTCVAHGYTTYTCVCGYSYVVEDTTTEPTHDFDHEHGVTTKYPTYILDGMTDAEKESCKGTIRYNCKNCDAFETAALDALTGAGLVYSAKGTVEGETQTIEVAIKLVNNPGVAGLKLDFGYNKDVLTLTGVANGEVFSTFVGVPNDDVAAVDGAFTVSMVNMDNLADADTKDKAVVVLTFTAAADVSIDPSLLWVTTEATDKEAANVEIGELAPEFVSYIWADANGDGQVTTADALLILQYLVKSVGEEDIDLRNGAADADRNNTVATADALLILQYLVKSAEWDPNGNTTCPF